MTSSITDRLIAEELRPQDSVVAVCQELRLSIEKWLHEETAVSMGGGGTAPPWRVFETKTWEVGEALRRVLAKKRAWKKSEALTELIRWVVSNTALGLGRQSFIELAAKYDLEANLDVIVGLVSDDGLRGQAIKALRTQRVPGHADLIREVIKDEKRTWVKREAKKYLSAFG